MEKHGKIKMLAIRNDTHTHPDHNTPGKTPEPRESHCYLCNRPAGECYYSFRCDSIFLDGDVG